MSHLRPVALASLLVLAGVSLGDPPVENAHTAIGLAIHDNQLVISNRNLKWGWVNKPGGTVITIDDKFFLRHDQDGVIRLVGASDIGDGCYWYLKAVESETHKFEHDGSAGDNVYQRFAITPRDAKLDGWGMTFFRGTLCLQPKTESRPLFQLQFHVVREAADE